MGFGVKQADLAAILTDTGTTLPATLATIAAYIDTEVAAIKAKTDNLPADPADQSDLEAILARKYPFIDFWAHPGADKITIDSSAADIAFPSIVVAGLPSGLTLVRVVFVLSISNLKDTSGLDNYINAAGKSIRVMLSTGAWGTNDIIALTLDNQALYTTANGERGGPVFIGPDIKATVTGNGTWDVQSDEAARSDALVSLGDDLELFDVAVGLRFFYH